MDDHGRMNEGGTTVGTPFQERQRQLNDERPDDVYEQARELRERTERGIQNQAPQSPDETPEASSDERIARMEDEAEERFREIGDKQG